MKTKKYYTSEEIASMPEDELRNLVQDQQREIQALRWSMDDIKGLLIAALQSLPKTIEL